MYTILFKNIDEIYNGACRRYSRCIQVRCHDMYTLRWKLYVYIGIKLLLFPVFDCLLVEP